MDWCYLQCVDPSTSTLGLPRTLTRFGTSFHTQKRAATLTTNVLRADLFNLRPNVLSFLHTLMFVLYLWLKDTETLSQYASAKKNEWNGLVKWAWKNPNNVLIWELPQFFKSCAGVRWHRNRIRRALRHTAVSLKILFFAKPQMLQHCLM